MTNCNIIRDLLPLCADGLASEESAALVEAHVKQCPACRAELARMRAPLEQPAPEVPNYREALCREKRRITKRTASFPPLRCCSACSFRCLFCSARDIFISSIANPRQMAA